MNELKVPYGLDSAGDLIPASKASKSESYSCPSCAAKLVHRAGDLRVMHFSHPTESTCNHESIIHITAKMLIEDAINSNALDQLVIGIRNHCHSCGVEHNSILPPKTFSSAKQEVTVSNYICDVVGFRGNGIALAIEILNTHKVDSSKAINLPVYWVELSAYDVIDSSNQWKPTQSHLKASFCKRCKNDIKNIKRVADRANIDRSLYSAIKNPALAKYIAETDVCFKCKEEIPIFWWDGVPFCEVEPPAPKPETIEKRYSKKFGGSYWVNTCGKCRSIQGDNYLYLSESAPFKNMPLDTKKINSLRAGVNASRGSSTVSEFVNALTRYI